MLFDHDEKELCPARPLTLAAFIFATDLHLLQIQRLLKVKLQESTSKPQHNNGQIAKVQKTSNPQT